MQLTQNVQKLKDIMINPYQKLLANYKKVLYNRVKSIKTDAESSKICSQTLPSKTPHHAETSQPTRNAIQQAGCNTTRARNQKRL